MSFEYVKQKGNTFYVNMDDILENDKNIIKKTFISSLEDKDRYRYDFIAESNITRYLYKHNHRENTEYQIINEATYKELIKRSDIKRKERAKHLVTHYQGVASSKGWITFLTNSQYTPNIKYTQYIELKEASDMKYFKEFKKRDIIRLFMGGDIKVWCSCPDFKYRYKYMAMHKGYGIFGENRFPKIRNPNLSGAVCKHLLCVFSVMGANWTSIARDMEKSKFFKKKYEDEEYMKKLESQRERSKGRNKKKNR